MTYQDQYTRYHDAKVTDSEPIPSNNGWIYTAYAEKAGLDSTLDWFMLGHCFKACKIQLTNRVELIRSPGKSNPPISRDEILGLAALTFLKPQHLNNWNFSPYPLPKFNLFKLVKQLIPLYKNRKNRNYFHENNLDQIYRFAFSVPFSDRHFILKKFGTFKFYNPVHLFYAAFGKINSKFSPSALDWLKYDEKKGLAALRQEFPSDHPIIEKLGL